MASLGKSLLLALAIALGLCACKRDEVGGVPPVSVYFEINVDLPAYQDLAATGGWLYLTGGSMGLIVYRKSPTEFVALDRHCTYQPNEMCRVFVDESEVLAMDTLCCGSRFLIMDGSVVEGPAAINLRQYNTSFNGTILRIYN